MFKFLLFVGLVVLLGYMFYKVAMFDSKIDIERIMEKVKEEKDDFIDELEEAREEVGEALEKFVDAVEEAVEEEKEQKCNCGHCHNDVDGDRE